MAFAMGISVEEFKHMTPYKLECCLKGHKINRQMRDEEMWLWFGNYGLSAVSVAVEHCLAGKKAKSKYIEKPIFKEEAERKTGYKESQEEVAIFEMKQRIKVLQKQGLPESPM